MKVSVAITTYNHEPFIAQALDSVLMQETDFEYEIVVGEDDSSDRTREIVQAYKENSPNRIRLFLNDRKNVIYIGGRPTGRWNFANTLKHTCGQYVALLEGDDYWTSPHKLQKQADFLAAHPECMICFHDAVKQYEAGAIKPRRATQPRYRAFYKLEDLLERNFIRTCSVMYRNRLFDDFPDWFYKTPTGDWPLHILNAQHGQIGYLDEVMAVHRVHGGSVWSPRSIVERRQDIIRTLEIFRDKLNSKHGPKLEQSIARWHFKVLNALLLEKNFKEVVMYLLRLWKKKDVSKITLAKAAVWAIQTRTGS